jgi:hypothetical protein
VVDDCADCLCCGVWRDRWANPTPRSASSWAGLHTTKPDPIRSFATSTPSTPTDPAGPASPTPQEPVNDTNPPENINPSAGDPSANAPGGGGLRSGGGLNPSGSNIGQFLTNAWLAGIPITDGSRRRSEPMDHIWLPKITVTPNGATTPRGSPTVGQPGPTMPDGTGGGPIKEEDKPMHA